MDPNQLFDTGTRMGIWGGTLLVIWASLTPGELLQTAVLAAIGAAVSFVVSRLLHGALRWYKRKKR